MILRIRYQIIKKDEGDCFTILFHYPKGENIDDILEISEKISIIFENKLNNEEYNVDEIFDIIRNNNNIIEEGNYSDNGDAKEELIITPHMYNQNNNNGLITCDKKRENIIFCGKFYIKKKYIFVFGFCLFLFCIFIWIYNNIKLDNYS